MKVKTSLNAILNLNPDQEVWFTLLRQFKKLKPDDDPITFLDILRTVGTNETIDLLPAAEVNTYPVFRRLSVKIIRDTWPEQLSRHPTLNTILGDVEKTGYSTTKPYGGAPLFVALKEIGFPSNTGESLQKIIRLAQEKNKHRRDVFLVEIRDQLLDVFEGEEPPELAQNPAHVGSALRILAVELLKARLGANVTTEQRQLLDVCKAYAEGKMVWPDVHRAVLAFKKAPTRGLESDAVLACAWQGEEHIIPRVLDFISDQPWKEDMDKYQALREIVEEAVRKLGEIS